MIKQDVIDYFDGSKYLSEIFFLDENTVRLCYGGYSLKISGFNAMSLSKFNSVFTDMVSEKLKEENQYLHERILSNNNRIDNLLKGDI